MTSSALDPGRDREERDPEDELARGLVEQLAAAAGTRYALFGLVDPSGRSVDSTAVWTGDGFDDPSSYQLAGTPCENVVDRGLCVHLHDVWRLYPEDEMLVELRIESYAGMPVRDGAGVPRAIVAVFDTATLDAERAVPTLAIFEARARAELERRDTEVALRESERGKAAALLWLTKRDRILGGVAAASERLLQAERWETAIDEVLAILGQATGSSRAYMFETVPGAEGQLVSSMRHEWTAADIRPTIGRPMWQGYLEPAWHAEALLAGESSALRSADDDREEQAWLGDEGTLVYVSVPIRERGRLWGYLGFDDCLVERHWSPLELDALRAAASAIGVAMEREQSDARLDARERILEAVAAGAERLLRAHSWHDAIDDVLELLGRAGDASRCWLFECEEDGAGKVRSTLTHEWTASGVDRSLVPELWADRVEPPGAVEQLSRGEPIQFLREELPPAARAKLALEGTLSIICVPVLVEGRLAAYIGYDDCVTARRWSVAEEEALRAAASVLGSAMQTAHGLETVRRRERMLAAVAAAAQRALVAVTVDEAVDSVLAELGAAAEASRVFASSFERHEDGLVVVTKNFQWAMPGHTVADPAIWEGSTVPPERVASYLRGEQLQGLARDVDGAFREALDAAETLSFAVVPITVRDGVWGVIGYNHCVTERIWDVSEMEALRAAAGALGGVIERELSIEALRQSDERLWQAQKMEAIGRLAAGVAHDLRNYLTVIVSYGTFVREQLPDGETQDADALLETARRVGDLVNRLLDFGRPQEAVTPELLDVADVLGGIEHVVRPLLPPGHTLSVSATSELDLLLLDRGQLERVIVNLALNARDAMPEEGAIGIVARPDPVGVALEVTDTGSGMDEETRARLFEPFFTTKAAHGSGLGLAIVYGIVTSYGGTIDVASAPDEGTCITVRLPRATSGS